MRINWNYLGVTWKLLSPISGRIKSLKRHGDMEYVWTIMKICCYGMTMAGTYVNSTIYKSKDEATICMTRCMNNHEDGLLWYCDWWKICQHYHGYKTTDESNYHTTRCANNHERCVAMAICLQEDLSAVPWLTDEATILLLGVWIIMKVCCHGNMPAGRFVSIIMVPRIRMNLKQPSYNSYTTMYVNNTDVFNNGNNNGGVLLW